MICISEFDTALCVTEMQDELERTEAIDRDEVRKSKLEVLQGYV